MKVKNYYREMIYNYLSNLFSNDIFEEEYIKDCYQNEENCIVLVKQFSYVLRLVKKQTPAICLSAVQSNYPAIYYVKEQTPEICMAAVQQNIYALEYIKKQTPEICFAAVQKDVCALQYVRDSGLRRKMKKDLNL